MKKFAISGLLSLAVLFASSQNTCPANIGFDLGNFTNWQCYAGTVAYTGGQNVVTVAPTAPLALRHTIIQPNSLVDPFGGFPYTPDNNPVVRLGFNATVGSDAERISYTFTIPASATTYSVTYKYAVVYQNPGHAPLESQPKFAAKVFDVTTGQYINNACFEFYYGTSGANGFLTSPVQSNGQTVMYKPWTPVTFILAGYVGHTIRLEFTNADCTFSGHWSYAYVDVQNNCNAPFSNNEFCPGSSVTVSGPYGYQSYTWWNSNFTQQLDTTQNLTLTPPPSVPTVYALDLVSVSSTGFRDTIYVTVKPHPAVMASAGPDVFICSGGGGATLGAPSANPAYKYTWTPSAGLSSATVAQPLAQPSTTTSYLMTATDTTTGCIKKDTVTVFVNALPQPVISFLGNVLTSSSATGNQWYLNGTIISGATGQTYTPTTAGVYTVEVTMNGCNKTSNGINYSAAGNNPVPGNCPPNIGFELGDFTSWQCYTGSVTSPGCSTNVVNAVSSAPVSLRHTIIQPSSIADPFGLFPCTPDNNPVARLGYSGQTGAQIERLSYTFTIPSSATQYSLRFKTAVVYQEPNHCEKSQPHFAAKIFDFTTGQYISCASGEYFPTPGANGFQLSTLTSGGLPVYYKNWTAVTLVLNDYIGHTIRIEFTNADCTWGGHWAYAYVDVQPNCNGPFTGNEFCPGPTATVAGPDGYQAYNWWNSSFTQKLDSTQNLVLSPPPTVPTVYALDLVPYTGLGCRDTLQVTVKPHPDVTANAGPDVVLCGGSNSTTIGTASIPGYKYNWSPSASLNNATLAQPSAQPSTTTTYLLTVTDTTTGCSKIDSVTVYVNAIPSATISLTGNVLTSSASTGNQWYLNGSAIAGATGSTYTATATGTYTVIVTLNGCTSTVSNSVNYAVTGIDAIVAEWKLQLVPNPTSDKLIITYRSAQKLDLEILDLAGRLLFSSENIPASYTVDLSGFLNGTYLVRLTNSKTKQEVKKLVVKL